MFSLSEEISLFGAAATGNTIAAIKRAGKIPAKNLFTPGSPF
jgi:hypothetical protein